MTKEGYIYYSEKPENFFKKAKLYTGLYIFIFILLIVLMFIYQIYSYFVNLVLISLIMYFLYKLVFFDFIYYVRKKTDFQRVKLMKKFPVNDNVIEFFSGDIYENLYEYDFDILNKTNVYILAKSKIEDSVLGIGLAVYLVDNESEAIKLSTRELSLELSSHLANSSYVKVILLIKDKFTDSELEALKYDSAIHRNTVVIGLEKTTKQLIYNYFLNGKDLDVFLSDIFEVDLVRVVEEKG